MSCLNLCLRFQKCCSCGGLCNFSHTTNYIVIGNPSGKASVNLDSLNPQAPELLIRALRDLEIELQNVPKNSPERANEDKLLMGALGVLQIALKQLGGENSEQQEQLARLQALESLSGISVASKLEKKEPFTQKEMRKFLNKAKYISQKGNLAAFLWQQLKTKDLNLPGELQAIQHQYNLSKRAVRNLSLYLKKNPSENPFQVNSFAELPPEQQRLFFELTTSLSKSHSLEDISHSVRWTPPTSRRAFTDTQPSLKGSPTIAEDLRDMERMQQFRTVFAQRLLKETPEGSSKDPTEANESSKPFQNLLEEIRKREPLMLYLYHCLQGLYSDPTQDSPYNLEPHLEEEMKKIMTTLPKPDTELPLIDWSFEWLMTLFHFSDRIHPDIAAAIQTNYYSQRDWIFPREGSSIGPKERRPSLVSVPSGEIRLFDEW